MLEGNPSGAVPRALSNTLGGLQGGGASRVVRAVAYTTSYDLRSRALAGSSNTDASWRGAIVRAFSAVRGSDSWDERAGHLVVR